MLAILFALPAEARDALVAGLPSSPPWRRHKEVLEALRMKRGSEPCVRPTKQDGESMQDPLAAALAVRLMGDQDTSLCHQALQSTRELVQVARSAA